MAVVKFYFDEMLSRKASEQLIRNGYTVILANDVGMTGKPDDEHLAYAARQGLVLVTYDRAFAGSSGQIPDHAGVICLSGSQNDIGSIVRALTQYAERYKPEQAAGQVFWLT